MRCLNTVLFKHFMCPIRTVAIKMTGVSITPMLKSYQKVCLPKVYFFPLQSCLMWETVWCLYRPRTDTEHCNGQPWVRDRLYWSEKFTWHARPLAMPLPPLKHIYMALSALASLKFPAGQQSTQRQGANEAKVRHLNHTGVSWFGSDPCLQISHPIFSCLIHTLAVMEEKLHPLYRKNTS